MTDPRDYEDPDEKWIWKHLPRWLASFIAGIHDMLPFVKGEWTKNKYGDDR